MVHHGKPGPFSSQQRYHVRVADLAEENFIHLYGTALRIYLYFMEFLVELMGNPRVI